MIDKLGKGSFCETDLDPILQNRDQDPDRVRRHDRGLRAYDGARGENDRGYECLVLADCVGSYFPEFQRVALGEIKAQGASSAGSRTGGGGLQRISCAPEPERMRLQALSTGAGFPSGRFTGVVHSVFRQACNIRTGGGSPLTLLASELGNAPDGVRGRAAVRARLLDHLQGAAGRLPGAVLRVGGADFVVDLSGRSAGEAGLETLQPDLSRPEVAPTASGVAGAHATAGSSAGGQLRDAVHARGLALARASRALSVPEAAAAIRRLVGCGPGLTPAGDDLIVAFSPGSEHARRRSGTAALPRRARGYRHCCG